jgi:threonine synthase
VTTNHFIDTRGNVTEPLTFTQAIIKGLAPGGGLFIPEKIPSITSDELVSLAHMSYAERAAYIFMKFDIDLPDDQIRELCSLAYGSNFNDPAIAPLTKVADQRYVLELWHGPTSAFKDMALQCLPVFFSAAIAERRTCGEALEDFMILVATSGDTGKAALEGFKDRAYTCVTVFYPRGGVSDIQYKQMATQQGANVNVVAALGNFDDCQSSVKGVFGDEAFNAELLEEHRMRLSSANSINWGRLLPQIVYYVSSYAQLVADGEIELGDLIDVCVPTGNFGNILGAYYAKIMGVPIDRLLCASNENCILTDFLNTGVYDITDRQLILTPSPSMDILISSNLERQLFEITGRDSDRIARWMKDLCASGRFEVDEETLSALKNHFRADYTGNDEALATIKRVYDVHGYLLDPHTAVAWDVADHLHDDKPVLIVSTAHWAKFGTDVYRALHDIPAGEDLPESVEELTGVQLNRKIAAETGIDNIPCNLDKLDEMKINFNKDCEGNLAGIKASVRAWLALR